MNQESILVKLLTQSKPIQYIFFAAAVILVIWSIKQMFSKDEIEGGLKAISGKK